VSDHSQIQWTDATWNTVTGCTKISPACARCYIERTPPFRIKGRRFVDGHIALEFHENRLTMPLSWRKPRRVFVNSLSDLFHDDVPFEHVDKVFAVMGLTPQHTYQILTKRPKRMHEYTAAWVAGQRKLGDALRIMDIDGIANRLVLMGAYGVTSESPRPPYKPFANVWLGCSVENQRWADERIPLLLKCPAAVRFLSIEPLLGDINLEVVPCRACNHPGEVLEWPCPYCKGRRFDWPDWIICGGESGPGARPYIIEHAWSIIEQCRAAGVPVFHKQLGSHPVTTNVNLYQFPPHVTFTDWGTCAASAGVRLRDTKGGDDSEWPEQLRIRQFPLTALHS
jgi:protein gp37